MSLNVMPPSVETCHWTVGAGEPPAAAVNVAIVPLHTVCDAGDVVIDGAVLIVSVAAVVFAVPQASVKSARYCLPLSAGVVSKVSVVEVAPGMLVNDIPPFVDTCHCTVWSLALLVAAAVKVTGKPAHTVWSIGFVVTSGRVSTVSVAGFVVAEPQLLLKTARYCLPLSAGAVVKVSVVDVAPMMSVNGPPLETCHCTV